MVPTVFRGRTQMAVKCATSGVVSWLVEDLEGVKI